MTATTNLRVLKKTRRAPEVGDIFVFQVAQFPEKYLFGRVIATDSTIGAIRDFKAVLIYLYRISSSEKTNIPPLRTSDLLVPPIGTNTQPWKQGFFEVVKSSPLQKTEILPQHCFRDFRGWFFDEYSNRLPEAVEPVGVYGVSGIGSIDIMISKALGLPLPASE